MLRFGRGGLRRCRFLLFELLPVFIPQFGFSDYVLVYLNDRLLYYGSDPFMSRDYRFLGTIGFFDMLNLHLKKAKTNSGLWLPRILVDGV